MSGSELKTRSLDDALQRLALAFSKSPGDDRWCDGCDEFDSRETLTKDVWKLSQEDYENWCWHADCMCDDATTAKALRYFIPRLASDFAYERNTPWCAGHFTYLMLKDNWRGFEAAHVAAIEAWFAAWIRHDFARKEWVRHEASTCAALCGLDVNRFFHEFREEDREASINWLAEMIERHWSALLNSGWPSGWQHYWGEAIGPREHAVKLIVLLLRESSRGMLEQAFHTEVYPERQQLLSSAHARAEECLKYGHVFAGTPLADALSVVARDW